MKKVILIALIACGCVTEPPKPQPTLSVVSPTLARLDQLEQRVLALEQAESNRLERISRVRKQREEKKANTPLTREERIQKNMNLLGKKFPVGGKRK